MVNFGKDLFPKDPVAIATYDYVDIAEGTGVVVFHGGSHASDSAGVSYELSRNGFYSGEISSGGTVAGVSFSKVLDANFEVTFIVPKIIDGRSIINIPIALSGATDASSYDAFPVVSVQRISDGITTTLFNLTSGSILHTVVSFVSKYDAIIADLPRTTFKTNDILRLQVQLYTRGGDGETIAFGLLGMDPKNRIQSGSLSEEGLRWLEGDADLQFHVPFKLDI